MCATAAVNVTLLQCKCKCTRVYARVRVCVRERECEYLSQPPYCDGAESLAEAVANFRRASHLFGQVDATTASQSVSIVYYISWDDDIAAHAVMCSSMYRSAAVRSNSSRSDGTNDKLMKTKGPNTSPSGCSSATNSEPLHRHWRRHSSQNFHS